jgi:CheY-like chemotaxis protein
VDNGPSKLKPRPKVLIIDSDPIELMNLEVVIQGLGFDVMTVPRDANQAMNFVASAEFDAAIIDTFTEERGAFPMARVLKKRLIPFFFTSSGDRELPRSAGFKEVTLIKPLERPVIEKLVSYLLNQPPPGKLLRS